MLIRWICRGIEFEIISSQSAGLFLINSSGSLPSLIEATSIANDSKLVTFGIVPNEPNTGYGYIEAGEGNNFYYNVKSFHEKVVNPPGNLANGAIYILSNKMMEILKKNYNKAKDFSKEILPNFIGNIYTYETKEIFADIGTINEYNKYK